ncbi:MAG: glycosyltransferase [Acidobacteria bacterium]|nr:glycosyltransferase [Acidobacteriota bacterium]
MSNHNNSRLTVVVTSDHAAGEAKSWNDLRTALRAWAAQDDVPADEFIVAEAESLRNAVPADLFPIVPNCRFQFFAADSSYELKNLAVEASSCEWIALVDADCIPNAGWLRALRTHIARNTNAAVVSAKTMYPGRTRLERLLSLLTRAYIDPGAAGVSGFVSGNAACYRREIYRTHPLPVGLGAFAGRIQSESILRTGGELRFEPAMVVVHDFEGWAMERDIRRNHGFCTVATRLADERLPYAGLIRTGFAAIPLIGLGKLIDAWLVCLRSYRDYEVKLWELPLALGLAVLLHLLEIPGMLAAYRGELNSGVSAYR